ncbi:opsin 7, group member b isoform X2 [Puntigrus tetrazona]|uniref:opsin 7, group member b isoform X2 n=1 Tax=Puntigrus tetrazona TaxID=1606681 RepID=UPI001C897FB5|nr:opsin 7, group member b isoform X2 [Puntigrus tetrazona]
MENSSKTDMFQSKISKENDLLLGTVYTILGVLSLMGNTTLLFVAYRKKLSLKPAEFFIINLSISDLGMTIFLFPFAIPSAFAHRWLFTDVMCMCYAFCGVLFGICSLSNLTVLSCVCWLKVCCPHYGNKLSSSQARLLVVGVWCYAAVFAVGPLSGWGQYGSEPYGTACCIDWHAPSYNTPAMIYIVCLFFFCYIVPCTIIILSYTLILVTVRGAQHAVQKHVSPQNKISNVQTLLVKLSVAVCIGFLMAWSPYAVVSMWAAFTEPDLVPPIAFAMAAMFAKSSTLYNPMVYLVFKPSFRKSLCRDATICKRTLCPCICQTDSRQKGTTSLSKLNTKDKCNLAWVSNGLNESHQSCRHCPEGQTGHYLDITPQRTARILIGSTHSEVAVSQLSNEINSDFL